MEIRKEMPQQNVTTKVPDTFHDVAAYFSEEEWKLLRNWQKELYKNVMKEIQQAFISLGPRIAASVFSLRAKEKEDLFTANHERRHSADPSPGYCEKSVVIEKECEETFMDHHKRGQNPSSVMGSVDSGTVVSFRIKEEGEADALPLPDSVRRESINCSRGFPFFDTDLEASLRDHLCAKAEETNPDLNSGVNKSVNLTEQQQASKWDGAYRYGEFGCSQKLDCMIQNRIHPEGKPYPCTEYGNTINQLSSIDKDQRTQKELELQASIEYGKNCSESTPLSEQPKINPGLERGICSQCGNCFDQAIKLNLHQRLNSGEQQTTCSDCDNAFYQSSILNKEQGNTIEERLYICSECGKGFRKMQMLLRHQKTHTSEKQFLCNKCGKSFIRSDALVTHQRIHTGERHYICSKCGKSFRRSDALVTHERIHTGEKPYNCIQCGKNFRQISHLIKHQRMHMGKNTE